MLMSLRNLLVLGAATLTLAACATQTPAEKSGLRTAGAVDGLAASSASRPTDVIFEPSAQNASPYGLFLAGNAALSEGDSATASRYLSQLAASDEADAFLKERAFTACHLV